MNEALLWAAAATALAVSLAHSVLGERMLLPRLVAAMEGPGRGRALGRFITRFAWHATAATWIAIAGVFVTLAVSPPAQAARTICLIFGGAFLAMGVVDAIGSRGRHVGWPLLAAVGVLALAAVWL